MKQVKLIAGAIVLAVLAGLTGQLAAQETNTSERTFLTFSSSVEMPGVTLQPGTYVFKLADTPSRNVVQVWNRDENNMIGQWLFVQSERPQVTDENVVMFREAREGATPAVQYWYFPGEKIGKEFVYPKDQATTIAKRTGSPVLSTEGEITATSSVASIDAQGNVTPWQKEEPEAQAAESSTARGVGVIEGSGASGQQAAAPAPEPAPSAAPERPQPETRVAEAPAPQQPAPRESDRPVGTSGVQELPRTASPLPLSGLIGLISLAGAMGLRFFRQ